MQLQEWSSKAAAGSVDLKTSGEIGVKTKSETKGRELSTWKGKSITQKHLLRLIEQQQYTCPLTGRKLTPKSASLDHIVPLKDGGEHDMSNVQIVHAEANAAKGTLSLDVFIELCRDVVRTHGLR